MIRPMRAKSWFCELMRLEIAFQIANGLLDLEVIAINNSSYWPNRII